MNTLLIVKVNEHMDDKWDKCNTCNLCGNKYYEEEHICIAGRGITFIWCEQCSKKRQKERDALVGEYMRNYLHKNNVIVNISFNAPEKELKIGFWQKLLYKVGIK